MNNILFPMAAALRTRSLTVDPRMRAYGDTSAVASVTAVQRGDAGCTHVGFKQGRPPRGVPR